MGSRKANEQAMTWLKSMAADKDSLDGINAELCINLINEQKDRLEKLGAQFRQVKDSRDQILAEHERLADGINDMLEKGLSEEQKEYLSSLGVEIFEF